MASPLSVGALIGHKLCCPPLCAVQERKTRTDFVQRPETVEKTLLKIVFHSIVRLDPIPKKIMNGKKMLSCEGATGNGSHPEYNFVGEDWLKMMTSNLSPPPKKPTRTTPTVLGPDGSAAVKN